MYFEGILVGEFKYGLLVFVDKNMFVIMLILRDVVF